MSDALDTELIGLLNRLTKVQKEVGGGKKEKSLAEQMGQKLDRFVDLYDRMNERLQTIKNSIDEIRKLEKMPGSNPRDLITHQGKVCRIICLFKPLFANFMPTSTLRIKHYSTSRSMVNIIQ